MKARAVKRNAKLAEKIHAEVYGPPPTEDPDAILDDLTGGTGDTPGDVGDAAPAEQGAEAPALAVVPDPAAPDGAVTDAATPDAPVDPDAPAPDAEVTATGEAPGASELLEKAEHKYSVLQGMHRKLLDDNNELRARLDTLEAAPVAPLEPSPLGGDPLLTSEDVESYGSDLIGMVKRAAAEELSPELKKLRTENEQLRNQISGVTTTINTSAKEGVYSTLDTQVPNWEATNNSEEFIFWLAQKDPFSGTRRHDLLTQAFSNNDSARVINFFNAYLNENTAVQPPQPAAGNSAPVQAKVDLVSMAAPGRAQSGATPSNQADERRYSKAEIADFYKTVQLGKFKGTDADKKRIEKSYINAANAGRVT